MCIAVQHQQVDVACAEVFEAAHTIFPNTILHVSGEILPGHRQLPTAVGQCRNACNILQRAQSLEHGFSGTVMGLWVMSQC